MTDHTTWHADASALQAYADGHATDAVAWSVETHLPTCATCRGILTSLLSTHDRATLADVRRQLAQQQLTLPRRAAGRTPLGAIATGVLGPWWAWLGTLLAGVAALLVADLFLPSVADTPWAVGLVPLLPLALVATVYAAADRDEVTDTAPRGGLELALLRTGAVLTLAIPTGTLALALAGAAPIQLVAWLMPGLGLSLGALVLGSRFGVERAALGLFAAWAILVIAVFSPSFAWDAAAPLVAPTAGGILLWSAVVLALLAWVSQRHLFDTPRRAR